MRTSWENYDYYRCCCFGCSLALFLSFYWYFQLRNENAYQPHKFVGEKKTELIFEIFVVAVDFDIESIVRRKEDCAICRKLWIPRNVFISYILKTNVSLVLQKMAHFEYWDKKNVKTTKKYQEQFIWRTFFKSNQMTHTHTEEWNISINKQEIVEWLRCLLLYGTFEYLNRLTVNQMQLFYKCATIWSVDCLLLNWSEHCCCWSCQFDSEWFVIQN